MDETVCDATGRILIQGKSDPTQQEILSRLSSIEQQMHTQSQSLANKGAQNDTAIATMEQEIASFEGDMNSAYTLMGGTIQTHAESIASINQSLITLNAKIPVFTKAAAIADITPDLPTGIVVSLLSSVAGFQNQTNTRVNLTDQKLNLVLKCLRDNNLLTL